jgi:predicted nuclease with TOPRIM domain
MKMENEARVSEFAALESQINDVQEDVREIRTSMTKVADALVKLAVIEERHLTTQRRVDRLELQLDDAVKKTAELEKSNIKHEAMAEGVRRTVKVIWTLIGAGVLALGAKLIHAYA